MTNFTDKRILVTGGTGFVGSNLANELAPDNEVLAVDNGYLGIENNLSSSVDLYEQSILDDDLPSDVDVVFHLAGLSSYATHEDDPCKGARVNVEGFINTVEQARQDGCQTIVYSSVSWSNSEEYNFRSPSVNAAYEASKAARERYGEYFADHYDMNVAGVRLPAIYQEYGPYMGQSSDYANVVAQLADDVAHGRPPTVYGDGTQTRDFVHVDDVVTGLIAVAKCQLSGIYGLGTGQSVSFDELLSKICAELDTDTDPQYIANPAPENTYVHGAGVDISKLCAETGWEPTITIEEGLKRVCSRYKVPEL